MTGETSDRLPALRRFPRCLKGHPMYTPLGQVRYIYYKNKERAPLRAEIGD